jgi:serine/threonine-protein kinase
MAQPNQRVGEYVLDKPIGRGSFGEVWRAHHHVWADQLVAIKVPTDPGYVRNLQREGVAVHGLAHPNIVRAIGFDPFAQTPYLAMEYVPGSNLRSLIAAKSLTPADAVVILKQVLAGLAYAHERGVVHRDVKPENILIHERAKTEGYASQGVVKITDFGLGRAANSTIVGSIAYSQSLNDAAGREIAGTLDYMAPEQRAGGEITPRVDLYACGVILYELLTGEKPAGTEVPSALVPAISKRLDDAFRGSYARLEKRFATAAEFSDALGGAVPPPLPADHGLAAVATKDRVPMVPTSAGVMRTACPNCRQHVDPNDQFCMHCGLQLVATVRRCKQCGGYPDPNDRFCIFCGGALIETTAVPSPLAERS